MKDWSGRDLCFECAKKINADINIGRKTKGRCHRCHSEQTLFRVTKIPDVPVSDDVCSECAHPVGTHAASCRRSELEILKSEREEIVRVIERFEPYDPGKSLADQVERILRQAQKGAGEDKRS